MPVTGLLSSTPGNILFFQADTVAPFHQQPGIERVLGTEASLVYTVAWMVREFVKKLSVRQLAAVTVNLSEAPVDRMSAVEFIGELDG